MMFLKSLIQVGRPSPHQVVVTIKLEVLKEENYLVMVVFKLS